MKILIACLISVLLIAVAGSGQTLDVAGNIQTDAATTASPFLPPQPMSRAPGDLLNQILGPAKFSNGLAHDGTFLITTCSGDGSAILYEIDETTGALQRTIPILRTNDMGVGYDTKRNLYVTANLVVDEICTFDGVNSTPVNSWSFPGTGYNGLAYDETRDYYWVCDWSQDELHGIDANTGKLSQIWSMLPYSCTRSAGVGFDSYNDEILVGSRDTSLIYVVDAATGTLKISFNSALTGSNDPQGLTSTPRLTLWHGGSSVAEIFELDVGHVGVNPSVDIKCNGGDSGVVVPAASNVKIDYDVVAGFATGTPADVWIVLSSPFGFFSYDGTGPISGWNFGLGHAFHTGALADMNGTALDRTLPIAQYKAHLAIDSVADGNLTLSAVLLHDKVDFTVF